MSDNVRYRLQRPVSHWVAA